MHYKNKSFVTNKKAFTLIELLIVIAIIGILFIVLISKVDFATDKAKATGVQTDFRSFQLAFETVAREQSGFSELVDKNYDKLEIAINKNLDNKLHIDIDTVGNITMANGAQDPWGVEYHGVYITGSDSKDRGAIVMYSNGANQEWGSEHSIANGVVTVNVPGNNVYGKDDYSIAVVYTYVNGYGEVKTQTSGFSQNQEATNNSNNSNNGDNLGDSNNVPVIGDTKQFATLIASSTLKDLYDLSTSPDKEYGQAVIAYNDNTYLCIDYFDDVYDIYYEFYNESEDYWYSFSYATEGIVELGYAPAVGWYTYDDYGDLVPCAAPYITFAQDLIIDMPNGLSDIAPLFVDHKHNYVNCECACGDNIHNYINCECACGATKHTYINCKCVCGDIKHNYINCECVCGDINHNIQNGFCFNCMSPGLYESGAIALVASGDIESARDMIKMSWGDLLAAGIIDVNDCVVYSHYNSSRKQNASSYQLDGDLVLPNDGSVTAISSYGVAWCNNLTSVIIPNSVTSIGDDAFNGCSSLTSITISDSVTEIGERTFYECNSLTIVTIPDSVTSVGAEAFYGCDSLTSVTIGNGVTSIGNYAFYNCSDLISITIPDNMTTIGWAVFDGCASLQYNEYDNAYYLGNNNNMYVLLVMAKDKNITSCNIHNNTRVIYSDAFYNCTGLTSVTIGNSVISIGETVFGCCTSLTSVVIPDSVTSIGSYVFRDCTNLTNITIGNGLTSISYHAFYNCDSLTSVTIPDSVTMICERAFRQCDGLTSVTIGNGVTYIGDAAFIACTNLISIEIPDSVTSMGDAVFRDCTNLTNVTIGDGLTEISSGTFRLCENLTSVNIGKGVTIIGDNAFASCYSLTTIIIPDSVTSIYSGAFGACSGFTSVIIPDSVTLIGDGAFSSCFDLVIYCEAESQPSGWNSSWNQSGCYVIWGYTGEKYTYNFVTNGGENIASITTKIRFTLPIASRVGYHFMGWYDNAEFSGNPLSGPYYSTTTHTLYAKWMPEEEYFTSFGSSYENAYIIISGESHPVFIDTAGEYIFFKFTATETKDYTFQSSGNDDTYFDTFAYLENSSKTTIVRDDDSAGNGHFKITRRIVSGETVYLKVRMKSSWATGTFTVTLTES
jgi:prepilin-type N-terminal cleavage/methylation domain-containing protein/uncharacterized repeat protein (TIGR02543 family)